MPNALMNTYARQDIEFERGEGCWLWDTHGRRYLDALSGIGVCGLGHAHPRVAAAIQEQAGQLLHTSNLYRIPEQEKLGARLVEVSGMDSVFFGNSGAEANEAAIKISRIYGNRKDFEGSQVVVASGSFHGRTMATLSATGNPKVHVGFAPLVAGFIQVPFGDVSAIEALAAEENQISAVLLEPIQGEGGVVVPDEGYLAAVRRICDLQDWLLMFDEVQTGLCRTGAWFAHQHAGITPDVMTLAKALGNGVPIGACLVAGKAVELLQPGSHGSTFGGNPLVCRVARTVLEVMAEQDLPGAAERMGKRLRECLEEELRGLNCVCEVRGKGLMIGIELDRPCGELVGLAAAQGLLINVAADTVIRLLPPLVIQDDEVVQLATLLAGVVKKWNAGAGAD